MKKIGYVLFIVLILFLVYSNVSYGKEYDNENTSLIFKEQDGISYPYFNNNIIDEKIISLIDDYKYQMNIIDDKIVSILFDKDNSYESILYNYISKEEYTLDNIVVNTDDLYDVIYEELCNKYPKYIGDYIKSNNYKSNYLVNDNEIIIHFDVNNIIPAFEYDVDIMINLNYHDIKDNILIPIILDESYSNQNIYTLDPNKKTVALTFDDGPTKYTKDFVSALADNHANGTFFIQGSKMKYYPEAINLSLDNGNEYGSHTYNHKDLTKISDDEVLNQINKTFTEFNSLTNREMKYVRPPYGAYNKHVLELVNHPFILWNIDSEDWINLSVEKNIDEILTNIKDKAIILMHETYKPSLETVESLLPILYAKGYQVVTVSKLMELNNKEIMAHNAYRSGN